MVEEDVKPISGEQNGNGGDNDSVSYHSPENYPVGSIARAEAQWSHREFVSGVEPDYVMINIIHARQLMKRGETLATYFGDNVETIITTTVSDEKLNLITWEDELEIVKAVEPDYHIPTDYSIYSSFPKQQQIDCLIACMEGTRWMYEQLEGTDITIIPLIKGKTPEQRQVSYDLMAELGINYCAFYASRYFTGKYGNRISDLVADVEKVAAEFNPDIMLIGLLSPNYISKFPSNVVAVAGQKQWRIRAKPREQTEDEMRIEWRDLTWNVEQALTYNPYTETRETMEEYLERRNNRYGIQESTVEETVDEKAVEESKDKVRITERSYDV